MESEHKNPFTITLRFREGGDQLKSNQLSLLVQVSANKQQLWRDACMHASYIIITALTHWPFFNHPVPENKLFIGMLSRKAGEAEVRELFAPFGEIREIYMIRNADGSSKYAAFLRFVDRDAAVKAIEELNHLVVMEGATRALIVKFADNKHQRQARQMRNSRRDHMLAAMRAPAFPAYPVRTACYFKLPLSLFLILTICTLHRCRYLDPWELQWVFHHSIKYRDIHRKLHTVQARHFLLIISSLHHTTLICIHLPTSWELSLNTHTLRTHKK
jgi:hypothetical protein